MMLAMWREVIVCARVMALVIRDTDSEFVLLL
jgi:hypothetical protein